MILDIRNLSVTFMGKRGEVRAVNGASLSIEENSFTSLVGESGSGKSVTALSVCSLVQARREGNILYKNRAEENLDLTQLQPKEMLEIRGREIAYVFQDPGSSLDPVFRVGEQVAETCIAHFRMTKREAREKALAALAAVHMPDPERVYRSFPHELSGGMKQRAMLASALIAGPRLLIADEPTTALDAVTERDILLLLKQLQSEKKLSVLFITHRLELATHLSDAVYVMQKGVVVERLSRETGFEAHHDYSKKLWNASLLKC